ncbi:hypothetical protein KUCAC02_007220 [Chaenocephalus aceratus]|uniref:Uncharacterized protein n=3 Tax=Chaenocephalus aceratus TaxID=36190 RepID=A0ACB9X6L6_CHAAC|nr:hypothetical protein KUCAC02_007220 [Chaenocephalus aceratus]KAI4821623.1 hypothetical protein KUCAC02_007220 [Chaenocephalus aceratus]KAI4821624.1 hypothetical protein KUCAC02_007220 [Chaenocephalus aceratus]
MLPVDQAECCADHMHCCPSGTLCHAETFSCLNTTGSIPWVERASADQPGSSKSFRMIKAFMGEEEDNICPDQSRCPPEFSCQRALTRFGCCPLAQGVPCSDGKHCCPEGHQCSADCRSCIKKEVVTTVLCSDVSECPDETTCCLMTDGTYGCCPMPTAVCCDDKIHCCPEGHTCDVEQGKCISSSTKKETPMWAKLPARIRADWENHKGEEVTAKTVVKGESEDPELTTVYTVSPTETEVSPVTQTAAGNYDSTSACPDNTTCCKNKEGQWSCCPLPEAVFVKISLTAAPKGKTCNLAAQTCDDDTFSKPWFEKIPSIPRQGAQVQDVPCDSLKSCPDETTCCKTKTGDWACCPLPKAVCCDDHESCCPVDTTCNLVSKTCDGSLGSTPMKQKLPAFGTEAPTTVATTATTESEATESQATDTEQTTKPDEEEVTTAQLEKHDEEEDIMCDAHTSCPRSTTCCFMDQYRKWGCCPLKEAVCCSDGNHCCPENYKCNEGRTTCFKGEVEIPWYTKLPATTSIEAHPSSVECEGQAQCPERTTCCRLQTGEWGCCPLQNAVCCTDKEHCCPQDYTCNIGSNSCQKLIMLQLETVPLTPVHLLEHQPLLLPSNKRDVKCDETTSCPDERPAARHLQLNGAAVHLLMRCAAAT